MPAPISDQFVDDVVGHKVDLLRYSEDVRQKVSSLLNDLATELEGKVNAADLAGTIPSRKIQRQEALIKQSRGTINTAYRGIGEHVDDQLVELAGMESKWAPRMMNDVMRGSVASVAVTGKELETLVSDHLIKGSPLKEWWAGQDQKTQQRFAQQVRMGVAGGETNDQIVSRIVGKKTGQKVPVTDPVSGETTMVNDFKGGVMDATRTEATTLVRTSVQTVSNEVLEQTYADNQDVLKGRQWIATLDPRTCVECMSWDGAAWDFDDQPLPSSKVQKPYPGAPPLHPNCRCAIIPLTKSWNELIDEAQTGAGAETAVSDEEAVNRMEATDGTTAPVLTKEEADAAVEAGEMTEEEAKAATADDAGQAASPLPFQPFDLGKGGEDVVHAAADGVDATEVHPADLIGTTNTLDRQAVEDAISGASGDTPVAIRHEGKLYVVSGHEDVAAAVYKNTGKIDIKIVDAPPKAKPAGDYQKAPKVPKPEKAVPQNVLDIRPSSRASMDGQVASTTTYPDWLKTKSDAFQDEVLGPGRARLFREGKASLADLVDPTGRPLTLEEINAKIFPDIKNPDLVPEWSGHTAKELAQVAGSFDLTPAETRLVFASLGCTIPPPSSLYRYLAAGADQTTDVTLTAQEMQEFQARIHAVKDGKMIPARKKLTKTGLNETKG